MLDIIPSKTYEIKFARNVQQQLSYTRNLKLHN